jgi:hypothetical protein
MRHKFQSIKDKGGLKIHLNETRPMHRGFGYKTYRILRLAGLNVTNRARAFSVTFDTMKDWDQNDDREQAERRAEDEAALEELKS